MVEYDVDLKTLEDMCSELSEACVLIDKDLKILWSNSVYNDLSPDPKKLLSQVVKDGSVLSQLFKTGRLMNILSENNLKATFIPVRYDDRVAYVLCIIDRMTRPLVDSTSDSINKSIVNHFLESMNRPALLFDKNMVYVGHNSLLDKEFKQAPAMLEIVLERMNSCDNKLKVLKSLIGMTHDVKLKILNSGKQKSGYVLLLYKKRLSK